MVLMYNIYINICHRLQITHTKPTHAVCYVTIRTQVTYMQRSPWRAAQLNLQGEPKKYPPVTYIDISAMCADFCMKFHTTVRLSKKIYALRQVLLKYI